MKTKKNQVIRLVVALAVSGISAVSTLAVAQTYPNKPIKLIVGFTPGGAADFTGRATAEALSKILGQQVVVENKPGAGSSLAAEYVSRSAAPDGYTILLASPSSISVNPAMRPEMTHTVSSLIPISQVSSAPIVLAVNPTLGINSVAELIAAAKKSPGKLNFASSGNGSAPHLGGVHFARTVDIDIQHIPYPGGSQASQSVIAGQVQLVFGTPPAVLPFVKSERLKGLAVSTPKRSPFAPELPGMAELGYPKFNFSFWYGLFAPAGTPPDIIKKLHAATQIAMNADGPKAALAREATEVALSKSPEDFAAFLKEDALLWTKLVKDSGVKAN
jgi:tripartite-type tricarboxylate transporter receptor subunit TctC